MVILIGDNDAKVREKAKVDKICMATFKLKNGDTVYDPEARILTVATAGFRMSSVIKSKEFEAVTIAFLDGDKKTIAFSAKQVTLQDFITDRKQYVYDCELPEECVAAMKFLKKRSRSHKGKGELTTA